MITLATCDSANAANTIVGGARIAYELHARGVPVLLRVKLANKLSQRILAVAIIHVERDHAQIRLPHSRIDPAPRTLVPRSTA